MEDNPLLRSIMPIARHLLGAIGGSLVGRGVLTDSQFEAIVGGSLALATVLWSLYEKKKVAELNAAKNEIIMGQQAVIEEKTAELEAIR